MRKGMQKVVDAFAKGQAYHDKNVWSTGNEVFSYMMKIAERREDGEVYIVDADKSPSKTTTCHINAVRLTFPKAKVME